MITIGLTGGSGAGKGKAAKIFEQRGIHSIDTDIVSREVSKKKSACLNELVERFGINIINDDGSLNRKKLAEFVFCGNNDSIYDLNHITHHHILNYCKTWLNQRENNGDFAAIIDAPLLFESGFNNYCNFIISVVADENIRIKRIIERDNITYDMAKKRILSQHDNDFFIKNSDFIIYNNKDVNHVWLQIDVIIQQIHFRG